MTFDEAKALVYGDSIHHNTVKNADGTPARARITGAVKLWMEKLDTLPEREQLWRKS